MTNIRKDSESDFEYLSHHVRTYLAETPPPRIVFHGNTWWLPDLSYKPTRRKGKTFRQRLASIRFFF